MRVLYHFDASTFSRRTRLALAHKGLDVELRDARANEAYLVEARRLVPLRTMPVLVDDGRALGDSTAISQYLDSAYPDRPRLWPLGAVEAHAALSITTAIDVAMNALVDMATRYHALSGDPSWEQVLAERMERARLAIDEVATKTTRPHLVGDAWSVADMWTLAASRWISAMPARAPTNPIVKRILSLNFQMPDAITRWAEQHEGRADVRAIFG